MADPKILQTALDAQIKTIAAQTSTEKRNALTFGVSTQAAQVAYGRRFGAGWIGTFAGVEKTPTGWSRLNAGVSGAFVWR